MREGMDLYLKEKERILKGGKDKYHHMNEGKGKMFVRKRLEKLFDEGSIVEDGLFANSENL